MLPDARMPMAQPKSESLALTTPTAVTVMFEESESVTTAGTLTVTYQVLIDRVWMSPQKVAEAKTQMLSSAPSVMWRRTVTVKLPVGTPVERITRSPQRGQANAAQVLLGKAPGLRQQLRRVQLRVGPKGTLLSA